MKCAKCGSLVNPGDQVCINCGERLSSDNAYIEGLEAPKKIESKNKKNLIIMYILIFILIMVIIASVVFIVGGNK